MRFLVVAASIFVSGISSIAAPSSAPAAPPDYRFKAEVLTRGMPQPMELEVAPDGRIFFNEISGKLKIYHPTSRTVTEAGSLPVFTEQENGFLGFALDPAFATNQWIYLFYSPKNFVGQRLSRFVLRGDILDLATEKTLLEFGEQRRECCHHAGSVEFGPDGNMFISTGDNTHPGGDSDGYAPIDERPDRGPYDAQKSSANTHDLRGKILRIRPTPEGGYTIPSGNLFPSDGTAGRPEIYVMGCRNPWRISVDSKSGILYWGEVGPDAGGDSSRGPRGYDEINQAGAAGNFGWPLFVGSNFAYADFDFASKKAGGFFDARRPIVDSPNNTGSREVPPAQPAFIFWPYGESKEFPELGGGGRTACAGPVFHFKASFRDSDGFPEHFDNCLLFYDWQRPFIKWARLDDNSKLVGIEPFTAAFKVTNVKEFINQAEAGGQIVIRRPVDSQFGPDGCLYLLDYGETWGSNKDAQLLKISYVWGNLPPTASVAGQNVSGREPLTAELSAAGSRDPQGDAISYEWRLHPGARLFSTNERTQLTLERPGNYVVELRVTDTAGAVGTANLPLWVGNTPPIVTFVEPRDGDFFTPGRALHYALRVQDAEDGDSRDHEEIFEGRSYVNARWLRADQDQAETDPGLARLQRSDCFNCHAGEQKIVGPSFLEIATRYREQPDALETSVTRVLRGSSGVWGEVPMLPHAQLSPEEIRAMVQWIYDLKPGSRASTSMRGLTGRLAIPADDKNRAAILEATYTDLGRDPVGSLPGQARIKLRGRQLEAEVGTTIHGARILGSFVGAIDHSHFVKFEKLNLSDTSGLTCRVASGGAGGVIEVRAESVSGPLLASLEVQPTGGWDKWVNLTTPIQSPPNRGDVYFVFVNPGKGGLMNLDWVHFNP